MKKKILIFGLLTSWMLLIFMFSNANAESSKGHANFVIFILKNLAEDSTFFSSVIEYLTKEYSLMYSIRKLAHLSVFCILQLIVFWGLRFNGVNLLKSSILSIVFVVLYAVADEFHQYFVPGRSAEIKDVMIDTLGGMCGLVLSYIIIGIKITFNRAFKKNVV